MTGALTTEVLEARVDEGIAWLHRERPGWLERIDLGILDLGSGCSCVLGQEWLGDYPSSPRWSPHAREDAYADAVHLWAPDDVFEDEWASARGFVFTQAELDASDSPSGLYEELTRIWRRKIEELRNVRA